MIISHSKTDKIVKQPRKEFKELYQLQEITYIVKEHYNPETCGCDAIARVLSKYYSNIIPVVAEMMIFDGAVQIKGHTVCKVAGTDLLLDPVGDYTNYYDIVRLNRDIVPWLYTLSEGDDSMYLSQNHMPFVMPDSGKITPDDILGPEDVLRMSSGPFYNGLRAIIL